MKWCYDNAEDSFSIEIGDFIVNRAILLADITAATYMVKVNRADADVDALVTLTLGSGIALVAGATEADALMVVQFDQTDFGTGKLEVGGPYYNVGAGIKTASMAKFLELKLVDDNLNILTDFIHD